MKKVFINGCFDILHVGHIRLFEFAKIYGEKLIVAIDSDKRVSKLKGPSRPINSQECRKEMLLAIKHIDNVCIFDSENDLIDLVFNINPDIMIVGEEYKNKNVIGSEYAKKLIYFNKVNGYSTTSTIQNLTDR